MNFNDHRYKADPQLVEIWVKGWSLAREAPAPVRHNGGFKIDVGWPQQRVRYVFPNLSNEFIHLAHTIQTPWVFLKACALPEEVSKHVPAHWVIQPPGFMMTCSTPIPTTNTELPKGYSFQIAEDIAVPVVRIYAANGEIAAIGRIVVVDDYVIYDRIETHPQHRRLGLGSAVMKTLEAIGIAQGKNKGVLVATAEGRALYETLGWQMHTPYTTAVIPED